MSGYLLFHLKLKAMTYFKEDIVIGMVYHSEYEGNLWKITTVYPSYVDEVRLRDNEPNDESITTLLRMFNSGKWKVVSSPIKSEIYDIF